VSREYAARDPDRYRARSLRYYYDHPAEAGQGGRRTRWRRWLAAQDGLDRARLLTRLLRRRPGERVPDIPETRQSERQIAALLDVLRESPDAKPRPGRKQGVRSKSAEQRRAENLTWQRKRYRRSQSVDWRAFAAEVGLTWGRVLGDIKRGLCALPGYRYCPRCREIKTEADFYRNVTNRCKACDKKRG
jgi:hypothetical protein